MITTYGRSGPPTPLIIVIAIAMVLGCFLLWMGTLRFFETSDSTDSQAAVNESEDEDAASDDVPTRPVGASLTPVPACRLFEVDVSSAWVRECPSYICEIRQRLSFGADVCVYGRSDDTANYGEAADWYIVDLNAGGAFRDLVYMHESVLREINPTATRTPTRPALPTITRTPTSASSPTEPFSNVVPLPTVTPAPSDARPTETITPPPPIRPSPTLERPSF